jgi:hypothetical protein
MKYYLASLLFTLLVINASGQSDTLGSQKKTMVDVRLGKGSFLAGGTLGLNLRSTGNQDQLIRKIDVEDLVDFILRINGAYAIKDNVFIGLGLEYGQTSRKGDYINTDDGSLSEVQYFQTSFSLRPFIKNHLSLDQIGRFNLINQTELIVELDQSITETTNDRVVTRQISSSQIYGLGLRPGILVFIVRNFAVEANVNLAGINFSNSMIKRTDLPDEVVRKASIDFKIDILKLNLGFLIYL